MQQKIPAYGKGTQWQLGIPIGIKHHMNLVWKELELQVGTLELELF